MRGPVSTTRLGPVLALAALAACAGQVTAPGDGATGEGAPGDTARDRATTDGIPAAHQLVEALDPSRFEGNIGTLAALGTRFWSQQGNLDATSWVHQQLQSYGYTVERHGYTFQGQKRENVYATKVGTAEPDRMILVAAHLDSYNSESPDGSFAPGADDNASGTALVLEAARVFAPPEIETDRSVRFIIFNNEETGLDGSKAYVADRQGLQGTESPPGSGSYPEPKWLGIIVHDMILFDHGLPPSPTQSSAADIDVEYQAAHALGGAAATLAQTLQQAATAHAKEYPAEVGSDMSNTDSVPFWDACPAVSVRENQRIAEIGKGSNPHWHKSTDVVATYSSADFLLGFNALQMTVGAVAQLVGARATSP
jgi:hypothetical protein